MKATVETILRELRAIYNLDGPMERYLAYVNLMTKARGEHLPLGDFSPMGLRQPGFLDTLIALDAERIASDICANISNEIESEVVFRVMLVVVDQPKNGWTQRFLTDASWRFSDSYEPPKTPLAEFDRWVTVQLWTTDFDMEPLVPTADYIRQQTRAALYRAWWQHQNGYARTLKEILRQEGAVMKFSGEPLPSSDQSMEQIRGVLALLYNETAFPVIFAALYGDEAAVTVGYEPLGLQPRAGFYLARHMSGTSPF